MPTKKYQELTLEKKDYLKWAVSEHRRKVKLQAIEHKGGKCIVCGYSKCSYAMVFHHRDPNEKDFGIGSELRSWQKVLPELEKCDLMCQNCHSELHFSWMEVSRIEQEARVRNHTPPRQPAAPRKAKSVVNTKIDWPSNEILQDLVSQKPLSQIAKDLGVSDNAIKKRCTKLGIPFQSRGRGYWAKLKAGLV